MSLQRPVRRRDEAYLRWIRTQKCCVHHGIADDSLGGPIEAHHVRLEGHGGMGTKPDDSRALPFCAVAHSIYHKIGRPVFEHAYAIDLEAEINRHREMYARTQKPRVSRKPSTKIPLKTGKCPACGKRQHSVKLVNLRVEQQELKFLCKEKNQWMAVA